MPPPRNTNGLPLIANQRDPAYALVPGADSHVVTVRMPNVREDESLTVPPTDALIDSRYSGWSPIWYGHQSFGWSMCTGSNATTLLSPAARLTVPCSLISVPPPGGVIVASTSPEAGAAETFFTAPFTVRSELDTSAAFFWLTCTSESWSVFDTCSR